MVELATQSTHDAVIALKDKFPTEVEDIDNTFGNYTEKEAKKRLHVGYQVITLTGAAGGPYDDLTDLADRYKARGKLYSSLLRGINHAERQAANETRYTPIGAPQPAARGPGIVDRLLRRTGAKQG